MQDGLTDAEVSLLGAVPWSGAADSVEGTASVTRLLTALAGEPWVQDGLTDAEVSLLGAVPWSGAADSVEGTASVTRLSWSPTDGSPYRRHGLSRHRRQQ